MRLPTRSGLGAAVTVVATALAGGAGAAPNGSETARPGPSARPPIDVELPTVVLPTGERLRLGSTAAGGATVALLGAVGGGAARALRVGGHQYVFPRSIAPVLGSVLDPHLLDASAIAERGGRTPVTVTYAAASSPTAVPGVEIAARTGLTGRGYVTPASSRALGAALARTGAAELFRGVRAVAAAAPGATHGTANRWPMHTLTMTAIGRDGAPARGTLIAYINTQFPDRGAGFAWAKSGTAKVSVPAGTYELSVAAPNADWSEFYFARSPEFPVTGQRSASVDLRTATTPFRTRIDRAVTEIDGVTDVTRRFPAVSLGDALIAPTTTTVFLSPTVGPMRGDLLATRTSLGEDPAGVTRGRYVLYFEHSGRIPTTPIRLVQRAADLARVVDVLNAAPGMTSMFMRSALPATGGWSIGTVVPTPARIPIFLTSGPGMLTRADYTQHVDTTTFEEIGRIESGERPLPLRQRTTEVWAKAPVHPTTFDYRDLWGENPIRCDSCISGNDLLVFSLAGGDTERGHVPYPDFLNGEPTVYWRILADGKPVADGANYLGYDGPVTVPTGAEVITATQTMTRRPPFTTGLRSETTWRLPRSAAKPLPAGYACFAEGCRILPMLFPAYDLPADLTGQVAAGARTLVVTVHQNGSSRPVGLASVRVRAAYGSGWVSAPVRELGGGRYAADLVVPRRGAGRTAADLEVSVTAADGSRVTDRVTAAFLLAR